MLNRFILFFIDGQLCETGFVAHPDYQLTVSVRGKTSGASGHGASFQWTSAVRALAVLCLRTSAMGDSAYIGDCTLKGGAGTLASSLDYAIAKSPIWLMEMFGTHIRGDRFVRRLFKITNPNRKRPGPVVLSINHQLLSVSNIEIFVNGQRCLSGQELNALADKIMVQWDKEMASAESLRVAA